MLSTPVALLSRGEETGKFEMRIFRFAFFALLLFAPINAKAGESTMSLSNLFVACTTPDMHWVDFCNGYMQAINDFGVESGRICTKPATTRTQLVETFERGAALLFSSEGEGLDQTLSGSAHALEILQTAFPCR